MSIVSVIPSNYLILCHPLLLLPAIFPSTGIFSNESAVLIRWPKYWSFSFSISPSNEYSGLIFFRMDWLDLLAVQGTLKSLLQHRSLKASIPRLWYTGSQRVRRDLAAEKQHPWGGTLRPVVMQSMVESAGRWGGERKRWKPQWPANPTPWLQHQKIRSICFEQLGHCWKWEHWERRYFCLGDAQGNPVLLQVTDQSLLPKEWNYTSEVWTDIWSLSPVMELKLVRNVT